MMPAKRQPEAILIVPHNCLCAIADDAMEMVYGAAVVPVSFQRISEFDISVYILLE